MSWTSRMASQLGRELYVLAILSLICFVEPSEELWCYDCNTDFRDTHTSDCNDPFVTGTSEGLIACPREYSNQCMKAVIIYHNIHVTVRGCVPSEQAENYCKLQSNFSDAIVECSFCSEYACNSKRAHVLNWNWWYATVLLLRGIFY